MIEGWLQTMAFGRDNFYENLTRESEVQAGSNRAFGLVMATACSIIAGLGYWAGTSHWPFWSAAAITFAMAAGLQPSLLAPLSRLWFRLGLFLHRVVNPLVMGLLFFVVITPIGLLMRVCGKRPLGLEFQRAATSYWVMRDKSELQPGPMAKQY
jgi:hypothetical protein